MTFMPILCKLLTANLDSGFKESAIDKVATRAPAYEKTARYYNGKDKYNEMRRIKGKFLLFFLVCMTYVFQLHLRSKGIEIHL